MSKAIAKPLPRLLPLALTGVALGLLAACDPVGTADTAPPPAAAAPGPQLNHGPGHVPSIEERLASCNAQSLASYHGGSWPRSLPGTIASRVYRAGDAVTMDHRPDRLNVVLNAAGNRVDDIFCG